MRFLICLTFLWVVAFTSTASAQQYYTFTDADGVVHFVDSLELVPPALRKEVAKQASGEPTPTPNDSSPTGRSADTSGAEPASPASRSRPSPASRTAPSGTEPSPPVSDGSSLLNSSSSSSSLVEGMETTVPTQTVGKDAPVITLEGLSDTSKDADQDKAYWQELKSNAKALEATTEAEIATIDAELLRLRTLSATPPLQKQQELTLKRAELSAQLEAIHRLLEEELPKRARKAGAPPGYLR